MATEQQVKLYLAYWFQVGKRVLLRNGDEALLPKPIFSGNSYSQEFENCWRRLQEPQSGECFLEGTEQTIQQLLSSAWEIVECAKCKMPIPMSHLSNLSPGCPCFDISSWPNLELPLPHQPADNGKSLRDICQRLQRCDHFLEAKKLSSPQADDGGESHR